MLGVEAHISGLGSPNSDAANPNVPWRAVIRVTSQRPQPPEARPKRPRLRRTPLHIHRHALVCTAI